MSERSEPASSDDIDQLFKVTIGTPPLRVKNQNGAGRNGRVGEDDQRGQRSPGEDGVSRDGGQDLEQKGNTRAGQQQTDIPRTPTTGNGVRPTLGDDVTESRRFSLTMTPERRPSLGERLLPSTREPAERRERERERERESVYSLSISLDGELSKTKQHPAKPANGLALQKLLDANDKGLESKEKCDNDDGDDDDGDDDEAKELARQEEEWSEDEEEDVRRVGWIAKLVLYSRSGMRSVLAALCRLTRGYLARVLFLVLYLAYFIAALCHSFGDEGSVRLLCVTVLAVVIVLRHRLLAAGRAVWRWVCPAGLSRAASRRIDTARFFIRWLFYGGLAAIMAWTLVDVAMKNPRNLQSVPGILIFLLAALLLSNRPSEINWHTIYWSVGLQFLSALIVLRWQFGTDAIIWIQDRMNEYFGNSRAGSRLMFGESYEDHFVIFGALPIIFITNATLTVLYYLGAMQLVIKVIGHSLNFVLDTSPLESMGVAAGIFMEGVSALLALRPFLKRMTPSQLFLVITSIFSSLGGAYLAILSALGISLQYIIPSMVISAPATFAVCKLVVPESKPNRKSDRKVVLGNGENEKYNNLMEAIQMGAISMLPMVGDIIVSAFTFVTLISWINSTTVWFGDRLGVHNLTIEVMASYVLYPVAYIMGIHPDDCRAVGMLMGYRIFTANFVAFLKMAELKGNKAAYDGYMLATNFTGGVEYTRDDVILSGLNVTLKNGFIRYERSEAIITYSLCGFSSVLAVAMTLGIMHSLVPNRRHWISTIAVPALVAGNVANCMTGCFAGIFF